MARILNKRSSFLGTLLESHRESGAPATRSAGKNSRPSLLIDLYTEHQYLLRLLELLGELVQNWKQGSAPDRAENLSRAKAVMQYLNIESDPRHHLIEDHVADRLLARGSMTKKAHQRLRAAHKVLLDQSSALEKCIDDAMQRSGVSGKLESQVDDFAHSWRLHIQYEESDLFPDAEKNFCVEDWNAIEADVGTATAPLFAETVSERYADMFQYLRERVVQIGSRSQSPTLIRNASAIVEKLEVISWGCEELREALLDHQRRIIRHQCDNLVRLRAIDGIGLATSTLGTWAQATFRDCLAWWHLPWPIICKTGRTIVSPPRPPIPPERKGSKPAPFGTKSEPGRRAWRVHMLNILLRVSLKRMLSKADVKMLRLAVGPIIGRLSLGFNPVVPRKIRAHDAHIDAVRAEWILPSRGHTSRVLLYLPGGGFFLPATQHHRKFVSRLGRAIRARGLLAHYRLAPDYPFPAGLEDAVAAYRHLLTDGIDPKRIVIVGDSAGGGLTLSTLLALRDAGQPLPAAAIVLSPLADLTYSGASRTYNRWRDPMLPTQRAVNLNDIYLKDVPAELSLVSPIFGDYTGLPPILAQVGSTEMLLDDTLRMAARARAHAVAVEVEVWRDMPHGWQLIDLLPESGQAIKHIGDFVRRHVPDISGVTTGTRVKRADVSAQQLRRARRRKAARSARQRALLAGMAPT